MQSILYSRRVITFLALILSGAVSAYLLQADQFKELLFLGRPAGLMFGPGMCLGLVMALVLYSQFRFFKIGGALIWVGGSTGAWYGVIDYFLKSKTDPMVYIKAGAMGGVLLAVTALITLKYFKFWQVLVLGLLGAGLGYAMRVMIDTKLWGSDGGDIMLLTLIGAFAVWQAVVGMAIIGHRDRKMLNK